MNFSDSNPEYLDLYIRNKIDLNYAGWFKVESNIEYNTDYRQILLYKEMTSKKIIFLSIKNNKLIIFDRYSICDQKFLKYYLKVK